MQCRVCNTKITLFLAILKVSGIIAKLNRLVTAQTFSATFKGEDLISPNVNRKSKEIIDSPYKHGKLTCSAFIKFGSSSQLDTLL